MSETPKNHAQFFPCPYNAFCDIYGCRNRAEYFIGRPDGPLNLPMKVCKSCAESIVKAISEDLLESLPRETLPVESKNEQTPLEIKQSDNVQDGEPQQSTAEGEQSNGESLQSAVEGEQPNGESLQPQSICPYCKQDCKNPQGLAMHIKYKHPEVGQ